MVTEREYHYAEEPTEHALNSNEPYILAKCACGWASEKMIVPEGWDWPDFVRSEAWIAGQRHAYNATRLQDKVA